MSLSNLMWTLKYKAHKKRTPLVSNTEAHSKCNFDGGLQLATLSPRLELRFSLTVIHHIGFFKWSKECPQSLHRGSGRLPPNAVADAREAARRVRAGCSRLPAGCSQGARRCPQVLVRNGTQSGFTFD